MLSSRVNRVESDYLQKIAKLSPDQQLVHEGLEYAYTVDKNLTEYVQSKPDKKSSNSVVAKSPLQVVSKSSQIGSLCRWNVGRCDYLPTRGILLRTFCFRLAAQRRLRSQQYEYCALDHTYSIQVQKRVEDCGVC